MALNSGGFNWDVSSGLARGISSAGQGLAQGIERMGADLKKAKAYRSMAVDALGMDPDAVDKMSLPQLEGKFQALAVKNAMEGARQRQQLFTAEMEDRARAMMGRQQAETDRGAFNADIARAMQPRIQPEGPAGMMLENGSFAPSAPAPAAAPSFDPAQFMGIAARHNQLSPETVSKFMGGNKDLVFRTSPTGAIIAQSPDTGAFQYDPFSKEKAKGEEDRKLTPRDARKIYNDNQERMSKLRQNLKLTEKPEFAQYFDSDALNAELVDLEEQNAELKPVFGGTDQKQAKPKGATETTYKSADEVRAAVRGKKLDRTAALKILKEQFGLK